MDGVFEIITDIMLDLSMFVLVAGILRGGHGRNTEYRIISATFAIGFLVSLIGKYIAGGGCAAAVLCALGFMLAYAAFVFTFPEGSKDSEKR